MKKTSAFVIVWLMLMALLGLTILVWTLHLGTVGTVLGLVIALAKAALVVAIYMHLKEETHLTWLMAGGVLFWLCLLYGLILADYFTRF